MLRFLAGRLFQSAFILLGVTIITFGLLYLIPVDPARMIAGRSATPQTVESIRHQLGLDRSIPVQYARYLGNLVQGDMGRSYVQKARVSELIASRLPATLQLMAAAIFFELLIGLPAGIFAATRRNRPSDKAVMVFSFVGVSAPQFVVGLLLIYVFAYQLELFPLGGYGTIWHVVLPALTLGVTIAGWYSRMSRSSMVDVLRQDYIRTARAKGVTESRVVLVHGLRNAILPIVAMIGIDIGLYAQGIVVVEAVFGWPGIGQLAWLAIQRIDIPIIMGVTLVAAVGIVAGNLLADIATSLIDPRVRHG
ncbi:MAG: ABC transporter permease [Alphaproteobacteria bacterium]|nr:ABC transporter permease [Alphaproteobacteria bacterium]